MENINYKSRAKSKYYALSLLCIIGTGLLLWLNLHINWQSDLTQGNRNTINQTSIDLLSTLDEPILLQGYFDSNSQTREQVRRFIERYKRFNNNIRLEFIDTQLPSDELIRLGFTQLGQLRIAYKDNLQFINRLNEQTMTGALFQVARQEDTWIAVIQGHGERDPLDTGNNGLSSFVGKLNASGIKVQPINLLSQGVIPDNTKVLVIAGARNAYLGGELELIEQYLAKGGHLLWLRDPAQQNYFKSLENILGIESIPGVVIDANTKLRILLGIKHAAVIPVTEFYKHKITSELKTHALFPFAGAFRSTEDSNWETQILFQSLDRSWSEVGSLSSEELTFNQSSGDTQGPLTLAATFTRPVNEKIQRAIVIGDSDFIANGYVGYGENFSLGLNIINWLTEDEGLISISHTPAPDQALELNDNDILIIALVLLVIVPALLICAGFWLRWSRNRH